MSAEALTPDTIDSSDDEWVGDFPATYGQYLLLHRLARGGMGNVFLAKTGSVMGIEKHCVVKTLRSRFSQDPEYVKRFMQEARFVVQLTHRNICPVFDVGCVQHSYYLAMELILGRDVRTLLNALADRGRKLPRALALHIAAEILDALDYAHRHVDNTTGVPLHIVHRDVSPQNVMVNLEGEVKLIDFGLAESGSPVGAAEAPVVAATVMGKMSYMAPEQARGEAVDARADQFAAAVLAYELLTGHRYYEGMTSEQVWRQAGAGQFRPAGISELPRKLRDVLDKGLAAARDKRFPTCGDFRDALLDYARHQNLHEGARELRALMAELFSDDLRETRELLQRFSSVNTLSVSFADDTINDTSDVFSIASSHAARTTLHDPTELVARSGAFPVAAPPPPKKRSKVPLLAAALAACAAVAVVVGLVVSATSTEGSVVMPGDPVAGVAADGSGAGAGSDDENAGAAGAAGGDDAKAGDAKAGDAKAGAAGGDDAKAGDAKAGDAKAGDAKADDARTDEEGAKVAKGAHKGARRRVRHDKAKAPAPSVVTFQTKLAFVKKHCPDAGCTKSAAVFFFDLSDKPTDKIRLYRKALDVCYDRCRK